MKNLIRYGTALVMFSVLAVATQPSANAAEVGSNCSAKPANMLACRLANYRSFSRGALEHAASCGFKYVFMNVIPAAQIEATQKKLAKHGLKVAVFRGNAHFGNETAVADLAKELEVCQKMGVKYMFISPKHKGLSKEATYAKLRELGDIAKKYGVVVGLETHPDLGTNGDVHLETMKTVNHPNIRVNFDTANITYYNKNTDAVTELKKIIDYVGTVEVKDHNGQFKTWNFPALGKGIVDIPAVLAVLKKHGYTGPITLEIEGIKGIQRSEAQVKKEIADSAEYIRSLGKFD